MNVVDLKNKIAEVVLNFYETKLLLNGKPKLVEEFTVLAAIVAVIVGEGSTVMEESNDGKLKAVDCKVISMGTGTKCVGEDIVDPNGHIIHDSHAEVIARRGLLRYLQQMLILISQNQLQIDDIDCPVVFNPDLSSDIPYQIKSNWKFYLYVSDCPCGDACIYSTCNGGMAFTGAKVVVSSQHSQTESNNGINKVGVSLEVSEKNGLFIERNEQLLCQLRTKSSRSDTAHPTNSMSCSDKICRWIYLGLQGRSLYHFLGKVELSGVMIGRDPFTSPSAQLEALQRALLTRCATLPGWTGELLVETVDEESLQFRSSKGFVKYCFSSQNSKSSLQSLSDEGTHSISEEKNQGKRSFSNLSETSGIDEKASSSKRLKTFQPIPCGSSLNWQRDISTEKGDIIKLLFTDYYDQIKHNVKATKEGSQEVTIAHTGLPLGTTLSSRAKIKAGSNDLSEKNNRVPKRLTISRLSPYSLHFGQCICFNLLFPSKERLKLDLTSQNSKSWKQMIPTHPAYQQLESAFFTHTLFQNWNRR